MKRIAPILMLLLLAAGTFAQLKVTKSKISFEIKNLGIKMDGTIGGVQVTNMQFSPANLTTSVIEATADVNTINTDNDTRNEHLKSDEFFDMAHYPKITMKSVSFKHKSGNNYTGQFNLTMKGKTKQIEVPFSYTETSNVVAIKSSFKLNRMDFGVGDSSMVLSDDVTVSIDLELAKG